MGRHIVCGMRSASGLRTQSKLGGPKMICHLAEDVSHLGGSATTVGLPFGFVATGAPSTTLADAPLDVSHLDHAGYLVQVDTLKAAGANFRSRAPRDLNGLRRRAKHCPSASCPSAVILGASTRAGALLVRLVS